METARRDSSSQSCQRLMSAKTCYVVHRLDMETSGLVLFAKNPFILPILNRLLEKKEISREYWALVDGRLGAKDLIYRDKIGRNRHDRRKKNCGSKKMVNTPKLT